MLATAIRITSRPRTKSHSYDETRIAILYGGEYGLGDATIFVYTTNIPHALEQHVDPIDCAHWF